jgi:hypothetical protein
MCEKSLHQMRNQDLTSLLLNDFISVLKILVILDVKNLWDSELDSTTRILASSFGIYIFN